jgi:type VI secretion system protein ImpA
MSMSIEPGEAANLLPVAQQAWLTPLEGSACGDDLEYDNEFLALQQLAAGKPETQFSAAEPPNWREVAPAAESLFARTRDLRIALLWTRAQINQRGLEALPEGLALLVALLESFWDTLHPQPDPDDGDVYARLNALAILADPECLVSDVRAASIFRNRNIGELSVRGVEIALGKLSPRDDETGYTKGQVSQMLEAAVNAAPEIRTTVTRAQALLQRLLGLLRDHVGAERATDIRPLQDMLHSVEQCLPVEEGAPTEANADEAGGGDAQADAGGGVAARPNAGLPKALHSRDDALKAIELVCDYLERTEPTNPAQLLLRRARRLINKNFMELMRELAPDAMSEVAKIMGVDPDAVESE